MSDQITVEHHFDTVPHTKVSNGNRTVTVWPGADYLQKLKEAESILEGNKVSYHTEIFNAVLPIYLRAREREENLQFFDDLKGVLERVKEIIELSFDPVWRKDHDKKY